MRENEEAVVNEIQSQIRGKGLRLDIERDDRPPAKA
jgi:hypothetical protein